MRVTGIRGQALELNGTNQYATVPDNASLDIPDAITLVTWVQPHRQTTQYLIKKSVQGGTPGVDDGYELALASPNSSDPPYGDGRAFVRFNQATSQNAYRLNSLTQYPYDGNTWIHLAATYDGETIRFYYNGIEETSKTATFQIGTNTHAVGIGAQNDGGSSLDGRMDDIRIYHYALSAAEIRLLATHYIQASAGANGTISPSGTVGITHWRDTTFTMTPAVGYHVADVLVDGVSVGPVASYTFTHVSGSHTIAASFAIDTFVITASAGPNGSIEPSGDVIVNYGANQAFTISPAQGYHVADVLVDGVSIGPVTSHTFTNVTTGHTIAASFSVDGLTIVATAGPNGTIEPSGTVNVNYGADQTFTITPHTGYHIYDVLVDGNSVGPVPSYTFTNVTVNHTIAAGFSINLYTITASAGPNGTISPLGPVIVAYGHDTTFTITPASEYHIEDVLVNGISEGPIPSYTFTNVSGDHSIAAEFDYGFAPIITSAPPLFGSIDQPYIYQLEATGIPAPTFALIVFPDRMIIDSLLGYIVWVPLELGEYEVTVQARNSIGSYEQNYIIRVLGCNYTVGDVNGSGALNGLDVVYSVGYFKGGPLPPYSCECTPGHTWYVTGDVNNSCGFNGLDVSYMVSYFKGGNVPEPCNDCPPAPNWGILKQKPEPAPDQNSGPK